MYLAMCSSVIFPATASRGEVEIRRIATCKVESSWSSLTDTAEIVLPFHVKAFEQGVRNVFRRGDPITINLGYNGNLVEEFSGYISEVSATIPVVIKCEDEMMKLKYMKVNKSYKSVTLEKFIKDIAPGYTVDCAGIDLGAVRVQNGTAASALQMLKDKLKIYSYFKGKTLVVGKIYSDDPGLEVVKFGSRNRVLPDRNLMFVNADDMRLKIEIVSYMPGGKTIKLETGDKDGDVSRLVHYNITDTTKLKALADQHYKSMKKDGYTGTFTAFGIPVVRHGQKVEMVDDDFEDRQGKYYVDATVLTFSDNATIRRDITLGRRAS